MHNYFSQNRNLADKDVFSKSDPMCVLFHKPSRASPYVEVLFIFMRINL